MEPYLALPQVGDPVKYVLHRSTYREARILAVEDAVQRIVSLSVTTLPEDGLPNPFIVQHVYYSSSHEVGMWH